MFAYTTEAFSIWILLWFSMELYTFTISIAMYTSHSILPRDDAALFRSFKPFVQCFFDGYVSCILSCGCAHLFFQAKQCPTVLNVRHASINMWFQITYPKHSLIIVDGESRRWHVRGNTCCNQHVLRSRILMKSKTAWIEYRYENGEEIIHSLCLQIYVLEHRFSLKRNRLDFWFFLLSNVQQRDVFAITRAITYSSK